MGQNVSSRPAPWTALQPRPQRSVLLGQTEDANRYQMQVMQYQPLRCHHRAKG